MRLDIHIYIYIYVCVSSWDMILYSGDSLYEYSSALYLLASVCGECKSNVKMSCEMSIKPCCYIKLNDFSTSQTLYMHFFLSKITKKMCFMIFKKFFFFLYQNVYRVQNLRILVLFLFLNAHKFIKKCMNINFFLIVIYY